MTALAIVLAVVAAGCFAATAVLQHRAVDALTGPTLRGSGGSAGPLTLRGLRALVRGPGWLAGCALGVGGALLHGTALVLAPLSVVQPVGVLAVPFAVLLAVRRTGRRPAGGVLVGVGLSVGGVAVFVALAAGTAVAAPLTGASVLSAAGTAAAVVVVLAVVGALCTGSLRSVAVASAGAVAFGLVSVLVRAASQQLAGGASVLVLPATAAGIGVALLAGGWLVQQGYAAGAPELVVACLTVVDPIVAVLSGVLLLGEGAATPVGTALQLAGCAVAAVAGVLVLARAEAARPAAPTRPPRPGEALDGRLPLPVR